MTSATMRRLRDIRESYIEQRNLRRELAAYTTEDDLNDIEAALERHTDAETEGIRRILAHQRATLS
ncbi:MAG: hypothetical protein ACRDN0_34415 [Trebonia sp.]